ncbi:MAG: hypothetical protein ACM35G_12255 [Planctomycetaceae bacterium]
MNARELDRFMPQPDVRERHEGLVGAPADIVFDVALHFDLQSIPLVRLIFWLRSKLMGAAPAGHTSPSPQGFIAEMMSLGWGVLAHRQGREIVMGAAVQPWKADVEFRAIPTEQFAEFAEPEYVKIAWTLEAQPLGHAMSRFASETRVVATDAAARAKFLRYWRWARFGIVAIRWLMLPAVRREAERRFRERTRLVAKPS